MGGVSGSCGQLRRLLPPEGDDHRPGREALDQAVDLGHVVLLARPEQQAHRVAQRVAGSESHLSHNGKARLTIPVRGRRERSGARAL